MPSTPRSDFKKELDAVATVLEAVGPLGPAAQAFVFRMAMERLGITGVTAPGSSSAASAPSNPASIGGASGGTPKDAKAFLKEKRPVSEVQRVAVLAYYLGHHKNIPAFKTPAIVALNQEAGGLKIGNPTRAVDNATRRSNYLVAIKGGNKKISAHGEDVVDALPDQTKVAEIEEGFIAGSRRSMRKRPGKKAGQ
jgi:hypothetical protein